MSAQYLYSWEWRSLLRGHYINMDIYLNTYSIRLMNYNLSWLIKDYSVYKNTEYFKCRQYFSYLPLTKQKFQFHQFIDDKTLDNLLLLM